MSVDTEPQAEVQEEEVFEAVEAPEGETVEETEVVEEQRVPLSALQKERKKRQDAEAKGHRASIEAQYLREQYAKPSEPAEPDYSLDESVTKGELNNSLNTTTKQTKAELKREIKEESWMEANVDKLEYVNENLEQFLAKRPNLTTAINESTNRYKEAYELMTALSPRQQKEMQKPQKKASPGSPTAVPKAAALNQAVDVMSMSDEDYRAWRTAKRRR